MEVGWGCGCALWVGLGDFVKKKLGWDKKEGDKKKNHLMKAGKCSIGKV